MRFMNEIAREIMERCQGKTPTMAARTWQEHLDHGHVPFRRDCRICQEASAKLLPTEDWVLERANSQGQVSSLSTPQGRCAREDVTDEPGFPVG